MKIAGTFIDLVKLGWGTSAVLPRSVVEQKCALLRERSIDVCPGGTLSELAYLQNNFDAFLEESRKLGFSMIEVSDGIVPMNGNEKTDLIKRSKDFGFKVVSEVGYKVSEEDQRLDIQQRIGKTIRELEAGASKVIVEARESGTLGIYNSSGRTNASMLEELICSVESTDLIFEAPQNLNRRH